MDNARKILPEKVTVSFGRNRAGTKLVFSHTHTLLSLPNKIKILILIKAFTSCSAYTHLQ